MKKTEEIVRKIIERFSLVAAIILILMMMTTASDVILRYFFSRPIKGAVEIAELMMVCVAFLGVAWCALEDGHIKVDLIVGKLPQKGQLFFDNINYVLLLGLSVLMGTRAYVQGIFSKNLNVIYNMTKLPQYPFLWVVSFSCFLLLLATLILIMSLNKKVKK